MTAPNWLCVLFVAVLFVWLPLDAWLFAWPAAVRYRNALKINPKETV